MNIAFQGEAGAFSEEAVLTLYPDAKAVPLPTFEAVFDAVSSGTIDRGVVPIENSLFGSVHQNYDLLQEHSLKIVAEVHLRIRHNLLVVPGSILKDITSVCSHPQALGQCRSFLREHLADAERIVVYDTAGAARIVAQLADGSRAAIASATAGVKYNLTVLAEGIESNHQNYTRFLTLARQDDVEDIVSGVGPLKTSVVYAQRENVPGSLYKSLAVFALRDIDLFKIESRPLVGSPGNYLFYLDLKGSVEDESIQNALRHLEEVAASVKVLGTYPTGPIID